MPKAYEEAGVSVEAGYEVVKRIKSHVARTNRPGVVGGIGGFGGLFDLASLGYKEPVLISGTDGVGTKLVVAKMANKHDTIGIDCVAMCVNDIAAQGAEPLFFLDYIACGKNDPALLEQVVSGVAAACARAGVPCVAVVGGMSTGSVGIPGLATIVPTPTAPMPLDEALRDAEELYALAADRLFSLLEIGSTWK